MLNHKLILRQAGSKKHEHYIKGPISGFVLEPAIFLWFEVTSQQWILAKYGLLKYSFGVMN